MSLVIIFSKGVLLIESKNIFHNYSNLRQQKKFSSVTLIQWFLEV